MAHNKRKRITNSPVTNDDPNQERGEGRNLRTRRTVAPVAEAQLVVAPVPPVAAVMLRDILSVGAKSLGFADFTIATRSKAASSL